MNREKGLAKKIMLTGAVIGLLGSGPLNSGYVFAEDPAPVADPTPTDPTPVDSTPAEPTPVDPTPADPAPSVPAEPAPSAPADATATSEEQSNYDAFADAARVVVDAALADKLGKDVSEISASDYTDANLGLIDVLDVSGRGLKNLKGFEKLTGLTTLDVSSNSLTTLDDLGGLKDTVTIDASSNLLIVNSNDVRDHTNIKYSYNMLFSDGGSEKISELLTVYTFNKPSIYFEEGEMTKTGSLLDLFSDDVDGSVDRGEILKRYLDGGMTLGFTNGGGTHYSVSIDADKLEYTITDSGSQIGKDVKLELRLGDTRVSSFVLAPRKLKNTELSDPINRLWHNGYGLSLYETKNKRVFYSMDFSGDHSRLFEFPGVVGGVVLKELSESAIGLTDGAGVLRVTYDYMNDGSYEPSGNVLEVDRDVKGFALLPGGIEYTSADGYFSNAMVVLKQDGTLVLRMLSNTEVSKDEKELTATKFKRVYRSETDDTRFDSDFLLLVDESDRLVGFDLSSSTATAEDAAKGYSNSLVGSPYVLPISANDVDEVFEVNEKEKLIKTKDGRTYQLILDYGGNGERVFSIEELSLGDVVQTTDRLYVNRAGEVYGYVYDTSVSDYKLSKLDITNVKKVARGDTLGYSHMFYLTNDGKAYFDGDMDDTEAGVEIDSGVTDIDYYNSTGLVVRKADGTIKVFKYNPWVMPYTSTYDDYDASYFGLGDFGAKVPDPTPTDPVDPTPTDPVDPTPTDPVDPTPTDPVDPTPTDPVDPTPTDPVDPTPTDPVDPKPTDPVDPKPTDPVDPKPTDPVDPKPTDPVDPKPTDPVDPKPTDPVDPKPTDPVDPKPTDPVDPKPTDPVDPKPDTTGEVVDGDDNPVVVTDGKITGDDNGKSVDDTDVGKTTDVTDTKTDDVPKDDGKVIPKSEPKSDPKPDTVLTSDRLPQTGESDPFNVQRVGIGGVLLGLWLMLFKRKKEKK